MSCWRKTAERQAGDSYFTVGLFSALDVLMNYPLPALIAKLPFNDEVKQAILAYEAEMGQVLSCVLAYENSDWEDIKFLGLTDKDISKVGARALMRSSSVDGAGI